MKPFRQLHQDRVWNHCIPLAWLAVSIWTHCVTRTWGRTCWGTVLPSPKAAAAEHTWSQHSTCWECAHTHLCKHTHPHTPLHFQKTQFKSTCRPGNRDPCLNSVLWMKPTLFYLCPGNVQNREGIIHVNKVGPPAGWFPLASVFTCLILAESVKFRLVTSGKRSKAQYVSTLILWCSQRLHMKQF